MASLLDQDEDPRGYRWETEYEKTWEALRENEEGLLQPQVEEMGIVAKRRRILDRKGLRLGMMRHVYLVIDMSESMQEPDLKPSRITCTLKVVELFVNEFFDHNPISQIGLIVTKNKRAEKVAELTGNGTGLKEAINKLREAACVSEPSLQNSLEMCMTTLRHLPNHTNKEVVILFGSLTTCDPGDIKDTIEILVQHNIRVSIVGLSAEVRICRTLAKATKGVYDVIMDENHLKDMLFSHLTPPAATTGAESSLIKMGFPSFTNEGEGQPSMCRCHQGDETNFSTFGYFCPQCYSKYCDLPVECLVCGLTLVSAAHLARSYHHLFPVETFVETELEKDAQCFSCNTIMKPNITGCFSCPKCSKKFCVDCDVFIHETLHVCSGCASQPQPVVPT